MKTLIDKSIKVTGLGNPNIKTVFDLNKIVDLPENPTDSQKLEALDKESENKRILNDSFFKPLTVISGRTLVVLFKYKEGDNEVEDRVFLKIPKSNDAKVIEDFILDAINNKLTN